MTHVAIVGAGIIGLGVALGLVERGADVTLIDPREPGSGASSGNTGWVVPALSAPVPAPGLPSQVARWMLQRDAPFQVDVRQSLLMFPWLWSFWQHCDLHSHQQGLLSQGLLSAQAYRGFERWRRIGLDFEWKQTGVTFVSESMAPIQHVADELEELSEFGYEAPEYLNREDLQAEYPELGDHAKHGFFARREQFVRPESVIQALVSHLSPQVTFVRKKVEQVVRTSNSITRIIAGGNEISVDSVVIAAGSWSREVGTLFGLDIPIAAGKGYSITVEEPEQTLTGPLYLADARIACTPFSGANRFAGMMELTNPDDSIDSKRVMTMTRMLNRFLPGWAKGKRRTVWAGSRPMTSDGLPILGRVPKYSNVFLATGHGMLGITMAPLTGELIAEQIVCGSSCHDLTAFRLERFYSED
jgi:D-amino-acid dehydrogenase